MTCSVCTVVFLRAKAEDNVIQWNKLTLKALTKIKLGDKHEHVKISFAVRNNDAVTSSMQYGSPF